MNVKAPSAPRDVVSPDAPMPAKIPAPRHPVRVARVIPSSFALTLILLGVATRSLLTVTAGAVLGLAIGLRATQRRRHARGRSDALTAVPQGWSSEELAAWLTEGFPAMPSSAPSPASSHERPAKLRRSSARHCAAHPAPASHLLDRWAITQVLWAGVAGWLYNRLISVAEHLVAGSSCAGLRRSLFRLATKLLTSIGGQSMGRTVAMTALATATTAGLAATAAGATETAPAESAAPVLTANVVAPTTSAPAPATSGRYAVQPGDTLSAIAARFGTTVSALVSANAIADPNLIFAGQVLTLTGAGEPTADPAATTSTAATASVPDPSSPVPVSPAPAQTTSSATGPAPATATSAATLLSAMPTTVQTTFACLVQAESSGNPVAVNPVSGTMGLLQFMESTWLANGGAMYAPTPLAATSQQQMNIGVLTYEHHGWAPWSGDVACLGG